MKGYFITVDLYRNAERNFEIDSSFRATIFHMGETFIPIANRLKRGSTYESYGSNSITPHSKDP